MISVLFRKHFLRTQMRQFSTALTCSRSQVKGSVVYYWTDLKRTNSVNRNVTVHRSFSSKTGEDTVLRPLMDVPLHKHVSFFMFLKVMKQLFTFMSAIDREFDTAEYVEGTEHAMKIISHALGDQNYEALEGIVENETLEILKRSVDSLGESERKLIAISSLPVNIPIAIDIDQNEETNETVVEISHFVYYVSVNNPIDESEMFRGPWYFFPHIEPSAGLLAANYTFRRRYKDGVGASWMAKVVNHFTP